MNDVPIFLKRCAQEVYIFDVSIINAIKTDRLRKVTPGLKVILT